MGGGGRRRHRRRPVDWSCCWLLTCLQMKILPMVGRDKLRSRSSAPLLALLLLLLLRHQRRETSTTTTSSSSIFISTCIYITAAATTAALRALFSLLFLFTRTTVECSTNDWLYSLAFCVISTFIHSILSTLCLIAPASSSSSSSR